MAPVSGFGEWIAINEREITVTQKITPFLWFDNQAEEAANFYASVFENSGALEISRYTEGGHGRPKMDRGGARKRKRGGARRVVSSVRLRGQRLRHKTSGFGARNR
jgi:hypothetical protein